MSITGVPLIVVLGLGLLVFPCLAILGWTRVRPRGLAIATAVGCLVLGNLTAVVLTGAVANRQGNFYTSWSQVFDSGSAQTIAAKPVTASAGTGAGAGGSLKARTDAGFSSRGQWATQGRLDRVTIRGATSRLALPALVYLPPQYFQPGHRKDTFPTVEVFTGYPGKLETLVTAMNYPKTLHAQISAHRAKPMILVMMRPSVTFPRDTECTDVPGGPLAETFYAQDVPDQVRRHYRVDPVRWGAIGDSTGGYCAAKLAMSHPATFPAAVSLSGYYTALRDHTTGDLWGGSKLQRNLNDLQWRLKHQPAPATSLLVTISQQEKKPNGYSNTRAFLRLAKPPLAVDSIITPTGGHNFISWDALLPQSLSWLSNKLYTSGATA